MSTELAFEVNECRICKSGNKEKGHLIAPCHCKGTLGFVHTDCLQNWLQASNRTNCEICAFKYELLESRRYGLLEGGRVWLQNPVRRSELKTDIANIVVLLVIMLLIVLICILRFNSHEDSKNSFNEDWIQGIVGLFLSFICISCGLTIGYLIRCQVKPFLAWWRSTNQVQLQLKDHSTSLNKPERTQSTHPIRIVVCQ